MLVDDEKDLIYSIKLALEDASGDEYDIISANSGAECFELLKNNEKPDLILLDIMMPEMSGWEVYDTIRENPDWINIPILFLTARTDRITENAGEFLGDGFIQKPIEIQELIESINKILDKE